MAVTQEPILARLDRLDNLMRHLEEMKGSGSNSNRSPKSWSPSTVSSGSRMSDEHASSLDFSPRSREKLRCRPIDDVIVEAENKGTLLDRVARMEDQLLKLCMQVEKEIEAEKQDREAKSPHKIKGLKQFVKSCVKGKPNLKNK